MQPLTNWSSIVIPAVGALSAGGPVGLVDSFHIVRDSLAAAVFVIVGSGIGKLVRDKMARDRQRAARRFSTNPDDYSLRDLRAVADAFGLDVVSWSRDTERAVAHHVKMSVHAAASDDPSRDNALHHVLAFSAAPSRASIHSTLELRAVSERAGLSRETIDGFEKIAILHKLEGARHDLDGLTFFKIVRVAERLSVSFDPFDRNFVWEGLFYALRLRHKGERDLAKVERTTGGEPPTTVDLSEVDLTAVPLGKLQQLAKNLDIQVGIGEWNMQTKVRMISDIAAARLRRSATPVPSAPVTSVSSVRSKNTVTASHSSNTRETSRRRSESSHHAERDPDGPVNPDISLRELRELAKLHHVRSDIGGRDRRTKRDMINDVDAARGVGKPNTPQSAGEAGEAGEATPADMELQVMQDVADALVNLPLESLGPNQLLLALVKQLGPVTLPELLRCWPDPEERELMTKIAYRRNIEFASIRGCLNPLKCSRESWVHDIHPHLTRSDQCFELIDILVEQYATD